MSHFNQVVSAVRSNIRTSNTMWAGLVLTLVEDIKIGTRDDEDMKRIRAAVKQLEEDAKPVKMQENGAYRSSKSVCLKAISMGIALTVGGKVRGKSEVEQDIKDQREPEAAIETIKRSYALITKKLAEIDNQAELSLLFTMNKQTSDEVAAHVGKLFKAAA